MMQYTVFLQQQSMRLGVVPDREMVTVSGLSASIDAIGDLLMYEADTDDPLREVAEYFGSGFFVGYVLDDNMRGQIFALIGGYLLEGPFISLAEGGDEICD